MIAINFKVKMLEKKKVSSPPTQTSIKLEKKKPTGLYLLERKQVVNRSLALWNWHSEPI